ncbi:MAG: PepSY domain-containing protein [Motiliproteus sp.]
MAVGTTSLVVMVALFSVNTAASSLNQEDVIPLVELGEVVPLADLLKRHQAKLAGSRLIDLELEREDGRLVYELEVIDPQGVVREYLVDAKSGEWLGEE